MDSQLLPERHFSRFINRCLLWAQTHEWKGKHRFYLWMSKRFGQRLVRYQVDERFFSVPLTELCFWLEGGPNNYYLNEFVPFCEKLSQLKVPFTFFDLGADIGTVSSLVASRCDNLHNIIAFEPNPNSFPILQCNLTQFNVQTLALNLAVSDFDGKASLNADLSKVNDHEGQIVRTDTGSVEVVSLDEWISEQAKVELCEALVVKIDVEGQEQQVIAGAANMLSQAKIVVILLEIHPGVLSDTNTTPEALFLQAESLRPFTWHVPAVDKNINRKEGFFNQFESKQYDVIGISNLL
ncbi:MAG: FkbM family methyltransferase [Paraglaciecola polaris]|uniref:FkbM family methyltransferase n=1 Tax=Paraglaciecola polaris TaxID=222814 RepID=UPI003002E17E|tara:strand:- start:332 stop:1216 length:885 start_codon:yes stop_codon:yes gene_type:complete